MTIRIEIPGLAMVADSILTLAHAANKIAAAITKDLPTGGIDVPIKEENAVKAKGTLVEAKETPAEYESPFKRRHGTIGIKLANLVAEIMRDNALTDKKDYHRIRSEIIAQYGDLIYPDEKRNEQTMPVEIADEIRIQYFPANK